MSTYDVASYICASSGWSLNQIRLHKIMYILNMCYVGNYNKSMFTNEMFEARSTGPVLPMLYNHIVVGEKRIMKVRLEKYILEDNDIKSYIDKNLSPLLKLENYQLIQICMSNISAWSKTYSSNRNNVILTSQIKEEYLARKKILDKKELDSYLKNIPSVSLSNKCKL